MKDLCVPIPNFGEDEIADIELRVGDNKISYSFRVESFPWEVEDELSVTNDDVSASLARIYRLKRSIEGYDKDWEIIQIFTPNDNARHIQVLYRRRNS
ncbi:hypothetical protein ACFLTA_05815 [Bacteroidota bacterium]